MWHICLLLSMGIFCMVTVLSFTTLRKNRRAVLSPINALIIGVFVSSVIMFVPFYMQAFENDGLLFRCFKTLIISVHHTVRLFIMDSDYELILSEIPEQSLFFEIYTGYASVLFIVAPVLTFGFVLSFFKNISAYKKYIMSYKKDVYVFSELNEKSLALAESVRGTYKNTEVVFAGIKSDNEESDWLVQKAKEIRAICFEKDVTELNLRFHSSEKKLVFLTISDNETVNLKYGLKLISLYDFMKNTELFVFSNEIECEVQLNAVKTENIKVRRISDKRSLVYTLLEAKGEKLFEEASPIPGSDKKLISAVVIGLGKYGSEMTKTLAWFGQMDGYRLEINAYDKYEKAESRFCTLCPELMDEKYNNQFTDDGEAQYSITVHENIDIESRELFSALNELRDITYVFVSLGSDEANIRTSIRLRSFLAKRNLYPRIQAVVNEPDRSHALKGIANHSNQTYDIDFVGDVKSFYAVGSIIDSAIDAEALKRHMKWGKEDDFWKYEYNYRSSVASALHRRMKAVCNIPGVDKLPSEREEGEKLKLRMLEHRRWNAYMRSEGFTFSPVRNNLAKTHNCLITYDDLTEEEKAKDDD